MAGRGRRPSGTSRPSPPRGRSVPLGRAPSARLCASGPPRRRGYGGGGNDAPACGRSHGGAPPAGVGSRSGRAGHSG